MINKKNKKVLGVSILDNTKRTDYPGKEISRLVQNKWNDNFINEIKIVVGDEWYAGNLSYHLASRPSWVNDLKDKSLNKIANVKSYKLPEKWSGFIAYTYDDDPLKENKKSKDSTQIKKNRKLKKSSSKNGYPLVIRNLDDLFSTFP